MRVTLRTVRLTKLHPLTISRGTSTGSNNLFVMVSDGDVTGIGECAPGTGYDDTLAAEAQAQLESIVQDGLGDGSPHAVYARMAAAHVDPAAMAAMDVALWDFWAKRAGLPLYRLLGLGRPTVATSVTVGINEPDVVLARAEEFLARTSAKALKVKLGGAGGPAADQQRYEAAREAARRHGAQLRVDANGGWSPRDAVEMIAWLSERDCDYVEQPLARGQEDDLPYVFERRKLPIYLDESLRTSHDVPPLAGRCDGVNLKLMKTGGITEALRLVATARAHGLNTMIGCMGESSVAIGAGASLGALFDHIDLDSHLNLNPDPAVGLRFENGIVMPSDRPGLGVELSDELA